MNTNTVELPMAQDFSISPHQPLAYNTQVAEVASPIVSSTSHPETEAPPNQAMVQLKGSNCNPKQTDNIGSIITMLIDEQNVDIEDILTEEQYRQVSDPHLPGQDRQQQQGELQAKIKEEFPVPEDPTYSYQDSEYTFHMRDFRTPTPWSGLEHGNICGASGGQGEQLQQRAGHVVKQTLTVPSVSQDGGVRDEKYWERRRKNNLAAKKSRDTRRVRENQLRLRVLFLENANKVLREQMERKDLETGELRERLRVYEKDPHCQLSQ